MVLSGCGQDEAERKRLELQRSVDEAVFEARPGRRIPLAVSVGAAIFPHDGDTYEALLATADSRMYRDKSRRKQQPGAAGRCDTGTDRLNRSVATGRRSSQPRSKSSVRGDGLL